MFGKNNMSGSAPVTHHANTSQHFGLEKPTLYYYVIEKPAIPPPPHPIILLWDTKAEKTTIVR
jgi:hypothetical protein